MQEYGKRIRVVLKAEIIENGQKRVQFFCFPGKGKAVRPSKAFYEVISWFRRTFNRGEGAIDGTNLLWALVHGDEVESEAIQELIKKEFVKGKIGGNLCQPVKMSGKQ